MSTLFAGSNCRAGLYSFAPISTWLREMGTASPPYLVIFGLILPDSRMLSGIASIGLTLANIAIILPYLRQPLLDSMHAGEGAPAHVGGTQDQLESFPDQSYSTQQVELSGETIAPASASPHLGTPLASLKSVCFPVTEPSECLGVNPTVALLSMLPSSSRKTEDVQSPRLDRLWDAGATEKLNALLTREGRSALYIPLPVPDAAEISFFESAETLSPNFDLDLEEAEEDNPLEDDYSMEDDELIAVEDIKQNSQLLSSDLFGPPRRILGQGFANMEMSVADEYVAYMETILSTPSIQAERSEIGESEEQRHESLKFIPQSVISRYPSALVVSTGRCFGHRAFGFGSDNQSIPHSLGHGPAVLLGKASPKGRWYATFFAEASGGQPTGGQTLVFETTPGQDQASLPEPHTLQDLTTPKKYSSRTHRRRLGVLARAALRNRRFSARQRRDNEDDGSSASDSDSDSDSSDSQYSTESSADSESMLPLMLGADLLAALDANSESGLNLAGPGRASRSPLTMFEEFLASDGSVADISMIMQVSSIDDSTDGEAKVPVTLRSLTYEDIHQWASGVVQKCVRQVCRTRAPAADPLQSPSQASDVCAEKPLGVGTSQCPFSGLHCKLGTGSSGHGPAPRASEPSLSLPSTLILPARKVPIRNIRDIPEFVPRQRSTSVATGKVGQNTKLTNVDTTRDAAAKVIARLESQAGFNARQCLVGVNKRKGTATVRGGHRNV